MTEELKPCPFCGGEALLDSWEVGIVDRQCVRCKQCSATMEFDEYDEDVMIKTWNQRQEP